MARCKKCFKKVGILADEFSECNCGGQELLNPEIDKRYKTIKVILDLKI